ncbi:pilus assembly protein TadG-related protein [Rhodopseudomonas palustris]|uniref:Putative Flp pilus-assembly TadG-like N-terminal domain-containing protein n=1 Tax=Rhodopseudomonas palustris (strain BisB18) TaxID=316056 RepID=Q211R8_RHOPB
MPLASPFGWLRRTAKAFHAADDGNIAVLFGIAVIPLISFVGVAVDYSRATAARSAMQGAADSATLMVSKDYAAGVIRASDIQATAEKYFKALYTSPGINNVTVTATYTARSANGSSTVVMNTSGSMPTSFLKVAGFTALPFTASSTSTWGATRLRVAMALDVTGSMDWDDKLTAMKTAAIKLVNTLKATASTDADVYISIIPFNVMVNVGTANKDAEWLDWDTDYGSCKSNRTTQNSCQAAGETWSWWANSCTSRYTRKSTCVAGGETWIPSGVSNWKGCVTDRTTSNDYDVIKTPPTTATPATLFLAKSYSACPLSLLPMKAAYSSNESDTSTAESTLKGKINKLDAEGNTNQPIGLFWAWMSLQTGVPLNTPAKDTEYKYTDAIILLSDGDNTQSGNSNSVSAIDARQKKLCDNIKDPLNGTTTIFTIQVNTDGDDESAVLKYCASDGQFFQSTTADQIEIAFQSIGSSLTKLRLAQ